MAQQTAIEWFMDNIPTRFKNVLLDMCKHEIKQAKAMEKKQIEVAFSDGQKIPVNSQTLPMYSREEYYNDTYNG